MTRVIIIFLTMLFGSFKPTPGVDMTFKNDSEEDFKVLKVLVDGKEFKFSNLRKGEITKPIRIKETYWFCETTAITQKDSILFTGFCSVGETIIKDGSLMVSYTIYPKKGDQRRLIANEVTYCGSARNVGFPKMKYEDQ
jgi:hypothetical protein